MTSDLDMEGSIGQDKGLYLSRKLSLEESLANQPPPNRRQIHDSSSSFTEPVVSRLVCLAYVGGCAL